MRTLSVARTVPPLISEGKLETSIGLHCLIARLRKHFQFEVLFVRTLTKSQSKVFSATRGLLLSKEKVVIK